MNENSPNTKLISLHEQNLITEAQMNKMKEKTPSKYVRTRKGRGGMTFKYVDTAYVIMTLNELFGYLWNFEIKEKTIGKNEVLVHGELKVHLTESLTLTKQNWGGSAIKTDRDGNMLSVADDLKAATSDCLKKCASMLGIAADIYGGEEYTEKAVEVEAEDTPKWKDVRPRNLMTDKQREHLRFLLSDVGWNKKRIEETVKEEFGKKPLELTTIEASKFIKHLEEIQTEMVNKEADAIDAKRKAEKVEKESTEDRIKRMTESVGGTAEEAADEFTLKSEDIDWSTKNKK